MTNATGPFTIGVWRGACQACLKIFTSERVGGGGIETLRRRDLSTSQRLDTPRPLLFSYILIPPSRACNHNTAVKTRP
jgi:hypothetical protein